MSDPFEPEERVIACAQDVREAIYRAFMHNADSGNDAANDDLVAALVDWKRRNRPGADGSPSAR